MTSIFQVISLVFSIEGAYLPTTSIGIPKEAYFSNASPFSAIITGELDIPVFTWTKEDLNGLYIGFEYQNIMVRNSGPGFVPLEDIYRVNGGFRWNELTIGIEHTCIHPVETTTLKGIISQELFAGQDKVFVKVTGRL